MLPLVLVGITQPSFLPLLLEKKSLVELELAVLKKPLMGRKIVK